MPSTVAPVPSQRRSSVTSAEDGGQSQDTAQHRRKKRVRQFTEDERAAHRIIEKERREAFKEKLLALAGLLPAFEDKNPQTLSKHMVVEECIAHVTAQNARLDEAENNMRALEQERDKILGELNQWRSQADIILQKPNSISTCSIPQTRHGDCRGIALSPTGNLTGAGSSLDPVPRYSHPAALAETTQANAHHTSLGESSLLDSFDLGVQSSLVSMADQSNENIDLAGSLGESTMCTLSQHSAQPGPSNNSGHITADMFDSMVVLEGLQPSASLGPMAYDPVNALDLLEDLQTYAENYLA